jgi:hypothetical protein
VRLSSTGLAAKIGTDTSSANIKAQIKTWWSIDATDKDINDIALPMKPVKDGGKGLSAMPERQSAVITPLSVGLFTGTMVRMSLFGLSLFSFWLKYVHFF